MYVGKKNNNYKYKLQFTFTIKKAKTLSIQQKCMEIPFNNAIINIPCTYYVFYVLFTHIFNVTITYSSSSDYVQCYEPIW